MVGRVNIAAIIIPLLSFPLSPMAGIDLSSSAIDDARQNALRNGVTNTYFVAGDLSHCDVPVEDIDVVRGWFGQGKRFRH